MTVEQKIQLDDTSLNTLSQELENSVDFILFQHELDQFPEDNSRARGNLFELLCYLHVQASLNNSEQQLISPYKTFLFYRNLYPDKEELYSPFDQTSLMSISVPDGLILNPTSGIISGVCEYSTLPDETAVDRKMYGFHLGKRNFFPAFDVDAYVQFVTPLGTDYSSNIKNRYKKRARFDHTDFSRRDLHGYLLELKELALEDAS